MGMKKAKVLVIAPYAGMIELFRKHAADHAQRLDVTIASGNLAEGVKIARAAQEQGYDILISRGGTATMIQEQVRIPTVDVDVSGYDFMRALSLAKNFTGLRALVGFASNTRGAICVKSLLESDIEIHTIESLEELEPLLRALDARGCSLVIGDVIASEKARAMGLNSMLLTSGEESVCAALQSANLIACGTMEKAAEEEALRQAALRSDRQLAVLTQEGELIYANHAESDAVVPLEELKKRMEDVLNFGELEGFDRERGARVVGRRLEMAEKYAVAFYVSQGVAGASNVDGALPDAVTVRNLRPLNSLREYLQRMGVQDEAVLRTAEAFCRSDAPVLLLGEEGTGKRTMAQTIHRCSPSALHPYFEIDCKTAKELEFSLFPRGASLCFLNADALEEAGTNMLRCAIDCGAFRVFVTAPSAEALFSEGAPCAALQPLLGKLVLRLPSLRERPGELRGLVNLNIIEQNERLGKQVVGIEEAALERLSGFAWSGNFHELSQIVGQLVLLSEGQMIDERTVELTLAARGHNRETTAESGGNQPAESAEDSVCVCGTLEEIELRAIDAVLRKNDGNVTKTANLLGISRSTLWRKLNSAAALQSTARRE